MLVLEHGVEVRTFRLELNYETLTLLARLRPLRRHHLVYSILPLLHIHSEE